METTFVGKNKYEDTFVCRLLLLLLSYFFLTYNPFTLVELVPLYIDGKVPTHHLHMCAHQHIRINRLNFYFPKFLESLVM